MQDYDVAIGGVTRGGTPYLNVRLIVGVVGGRKWSRHITLKVFKLCKQNLAR